MDKLRGVMQQAQGSNGEFKASLRLVCDSWQQPDHKLQAIVALLSKAFGNAGVAVFQYLGNSSATLAEIRVDKSQRIPLLEVLEVLKTERSDGYLKLEMARSNNTRIVGLNLFAKTNGSPVGCLVVLFEKQPNIPREMQKMLVLAKEFIQDQFSTDWSGQ